jgi:CarD family transcriptional regulator
LYNVGDHVVYPMHGAGVIVAIEEREVLGERQKYYIMQLPIGDMKISWSWEKNSTSWWIL